MARHVENYGTKCVRARRFKMRERQVCVQIICDYMSKIVYNENERWRVFSNKPRLFEKRGKRRIDETILTSIAHKMRALLAKRVERRRNVESAVVLKKLNEAIDEKKNARLRGAVCTMKKQRRWR